MNPSSARAKCGSWVPARATPTCSSYETVDVLRSPEIRDGIKAFSEWPTIPQLYIDGQFIGGSDIVSEMHASGELHKLIGVKV